MKETLLGKTLVQNGLVTPAQLKEALALQVQSPERLLGHILVDKGYLRYATLVTTIVSHQHLPMARYMLAERDRAGEQLDENGVPLPRVSEEEMKALAIEVKEFPVPLPTPSLEYFKLDSSMERELAEDAFSLIDHGQMEEAKQVLVQGLTISPDSQPLRYLQCWLLAEQGKAEQSLQTLEKNLPDFTRNPTLLWLAAYSRQRLHRHNEAVENYQALLKKHKPNNHWYFGLAYSLQHLHYWKKARQVYTHFIRISSGENKWTVYAREQISIIVKQHGG